MAQLIDNSNHYDEHGGPNEYMFRLNPDISISMNVLSAVEQIENEDMSDMKPVLNEWIDIYALDRMYEKQSQKVSQDIELEFTFESYRIIVKKATMIFKCYRSIE